MNSRLAIAVVLVIPCLLYGCSGQQDPEFALSEDTLALPREARDGYRSDLKDADGKVVKVPGVRDYLLQYFGTPSELVAWQRMPVNYDLPDAGDADAETEEAGPSGENLKFGQKLYLTHCMHCHGVSGDGKGPTAKYLNPKPRDYRRGTFKFTSTAATITRAANRADLTRIIKIGIPGTYMPSFMLLKDEEMQAIVEYVRWLSMRGRFERTMSVTLLGSYKEQKDGKGKDGSDKRKERLDELKAYLASVGDYEGAGFQEELDESTTFMVEDWNAAENPDNLLFPQLARVEATAESIAKGRSLFLSKELKCNDCHGDTAQGNGPQTRAYLKDDAGVTYSGAGLHDVWGNAQKPRNLTQGIYRGGRRPLDIYRRIRAGVKGTIMPAFKENVISDEDVWNLVNYVLSVPIQGAIPPAID